jgi:hypothetical protein
MAGKRNTNEYSEEDDIDEIIERLDPRLAVKIEIDEQFIDRLFQDEPKKKDDSLDGLFEEDKSSLHRGFQDEVQKALSQPEMSKASLYRMKSKEPTFKAFDEEIAKLKSVEEIWEESSQGATKTLNRKALIALYVFITVIITMIIWAIFTSLNDKRDSDAQLNALTSETINKELQEKKLNIEIKEISELIDRYLSATTKLEKIECIYKADDLINEIDRYFKEHERFKSPSDYVIDSILPISVNGENLWEVLVIEKTISGERFHNYYVRKNSDGDYKVDWQEDVIFQENDVVKFKETQSRESTSIKFIVEVITGMSAYNWGFMETDYQVFRLREPNSEMVFWGYVRRGSPEQMKLNQSIENDLKNTLSKKTVRHEFILKVRFLPDSPTTNDQYILIDDIVSHKWLTINK